MSTRPSRLLLAALLLTAAACRSLPEDAGAAPLAAEPAAAPVEPAPEHAPVAAAEEPHAAPTAHGSHGDHGAAPADGQAPNRDLHGPADTERYIRMLADEQRVAELKPELVAERIAEHAGLGPDAVIADLGCGPGVFAWPFARLVPRGHVLAIDVEPRQLDALRAGIAERGVENVVPVLASYDAAHIPPGGADVIFVADTYHHFEDRVAYFRGLRGSLTPGGHLVLLEYKDGDLPIGPPADHKVPRVERHAELEEAGYELVTSLATHIWHDFEFWRLRRADR